MDVMKDERRPLEKIEEAKTRFFNTHNLPWILINKMYFGAAMAAHLYARTKVGSTLGINMFGPEVTTLVSNLQKHGNNMFDGDVSKWDSRLDQHRLMKIAEMYINWYNGQNGNPISDGRVRRIVASNLTWRFHVVGRKVYICFSGMPSGSLFTSWWNTDTHNISDYHLCMDIAEDLGCAEMGLPAEVDKHKFAVKHGDDDIQSVDDIMAEWYTPENLKKAWKHRGVDYTPPQKTKTLDGITKEFIGIEEIQYLKCKFKRDEIYPQYWHMAMSIPNTCQELTNWVRSGDTPENMLISNIEDAYRFMLGHGEKAFRSFQARVEGELQKRGLRLPTLTYESLRYSWEHEHEIL
nr:MAG: nonstructural protein [Riboviria sp.]